METIYKGKFSRIVVEKVHTKGGGSYTHAITVADPVASVLPVFENGDILLERQYRSAIRRWVYEIPGGHIDKGESPAAAARRELEEETGYRASRVKMLYTIYESPAGKRQLMSIFLATGLRHGTKQLEESERITIKRVSMKSALSMLMSNEIIDLKTMAAILFYHAFFSGRKRADK